MQNMGTWNSDMAMIYLALFLFPLVMLILREIVAIWPQPKTITKVKYVQLPTQTETVYKTKTEVVYRNVYKERKVPAAYAKKKPPTQVEPLPISKYCDNIKKDTISALRSIGMTKSDAKFLTDTKFDPNKHSNFESLFKDCMNQS